jgi:predicted kinase
MKQACLIVLVGAPGSGKSTWAAEHGSGAVHVSQDGLIDAITPHGFEHGYREIYYEAENAIARAAIRAGHTVIVDRTNRTRGHRERWLGMAREEGCRVMAVVMTTPADLCRARNSQRIGPRRLNEERMERMLAAMEAVTADEGFDSITFSGGVSA